MSIKKQFKQVLVFSFVSKLSFYVPFLAFFLENYKGMTSPQIALVFSIYAISIVILELPLGYLSDMVGEKVTIMLGSVALFFSSFFLTIGNLYGVIAAEILLAFAQASFSGSLDSFLWKRIRVVSAKNESLKSKMTSTYTSMAWAGVFASSLLGIVLNYIHPYLPFAFTSVTNLLLLLIAISLPRNERSDEKAEFSVLSIYYEIRDNRIFQLWFLISIMTSATLVSAFLMLQVLLLEKGISVSYNGYLYLLFSLSAFFGAFFSVKFNDIFTSCASRFSILMLGLFASLIGISLANHIVLTMAVVILFRLLWGISGPFFLTQINASFEKDSIRSSMLSFVSLGSSLGSSLLLFISGFFELTASSQFLAFSIVFAFNMLVYLAFRLVRTNSEMENGS